MVVAGSVAYAYVRHKLALKEHQKGQGQYHPISTDGNGEDPFERVVVEKDSSAKR